LALVLAFGTLHLTANSPRDGSALIYMPSAAQDVLLRAQKAVKSSYQLRATHRPGNRINHRKKHTEL